MKPTAAARLLRRAGPTIASAAGIGRRRIATAPATRPGALVASIAIRGRNTRTPRRTSGTASRTRFASATSNAGRAIPRRSPRPMVISFAAPMSATAGESARASSVGRAVGRRIATARRHVRTAIDSGSSVRVATGGPAIATRAETNGETNRAIVPLNHAGMRGAIGRLAAKMIGGTGNRSRPAVSERSRSGASPLRARGPARSPLRQSPSMPRGVDHLAAAQTFASGVRIGRPGAGAMTNSR